MTIKLLNHHVRPQFSWREFGVFDAWADKGLLPTLGDVHRIVIPKLKEAVDDDGTKLYPFLTKEPHTRRIFEHRWLEGYQAFLAGDYIIIPDFDPETGRANRDYLCEACPTWGRRCQNKISHTKEGW
ncbi:MAG: hypothetical protein UR56_C0002G0064 [Candidatus Roizmanbacteria bacterium GW2011_GWC2_34_23]|uniref:Uncharacterized protein n=1 Tax=Candidatus Roizmanbacteria bacterium GW2011_GWC2_34_23 TaxID=1618484 RepID=A0A0G0E6V9_9BACT|nr:MAG: hypothetical protein UR56_C0002G0064 [Candidatus Roizmanbacteria bacterium GW2011_GWC2_34_23]